MAADSPPGLAFPTQPGDDVPAPLPPLAAPGVARKYHRHMARSARQRESVAALPSIKDLQARFSGAGARVEHRAGMGVGIRSSPLGATLEEGGDDWVSSGSALGSSSGNGGSTAPSSLMSGGDVERRQRRPWKEVSLPRVGAAEARLEAAQLAAAMRARWGQPDASGIDTPPVEDLRAVFVDSARAVRRVRSLTLSLVPAGQRRVSAPIARPNTSVFSTPSRPAGKPVQRVVSSSAAVISGLPNANGEGRSALGVGAAPSMPDPSAPIRRAAIDLLGNLRTLEEQVRVAPAPAPMVVVTQGLGGGYELVDSPATDTAHPPLPTDERDAHRDASPASSTAPSSGAHLASPRSSARPLSVHSGSSFEDSMYDILSDDEEWSINAVAREAEARQPHRPWEERIVAESRDYAVRSGEGWGEVSDGVREAALRWADVVERVFGEMEDVKHTWADEGGSTIDRASAFLVAHLDPTHAALLPSADEGQAFLERLSDGFLLCQAYNASLAASPRPWGFIPGEDMHDTLDAKEGREWTFRRVGNLTCWAAALRLRYNLPITLPPAPLAPHTMPEVKLPSASDAPPAPSPKLPSSPRLGDVLLPAETQPRNANRRRSGLRFEPMTVAKRGDGWEHMLEGMLGIWLSEAAKEGAGDADVSGLNLEEAPAEEEAEPATPLTPLTPGIPVTPATPAVERARERGKEEEGALPSDWEAAARAAVE